MKRNRKIIIFMLLFVIYIAQGLIFFVSNKEIVSNVENNGDLNNMDYYVDVTDVIAEISDLGFNIDNLKKENDKINVSAFINSSKEDIFSSLKNLKEFKCFIDDYTITKHNDIDVRFNLRIQ